MYLAEFSLISVCLLLSQTVLLVHGGGSGDPDDFRKLTAGVRKKCLKETQTPREMLENTDYGEFPEDDRLKCYFNCALGKFNMMDAAGNIKYKTLKMFIPEPYKELGAEMVDSCTDVTGENNCDKAFKFMRCMFYVNPMAFIAP